MSEKIGTWTPWNGTPLGLPEVEELATGAAAHARSGGTAYLMSGDSIVVASKRKNGSVELIWCLVRGTKDAR